MKIEEIHQLNEDFLKAFPLESLKEMTIEQYTNLNRSNSFCYWLERKTQMLGGIGGGSSFKFGLYEYRNKPKEQNFDVLIDGKYAWCAWLGSTAEEAFNNIRDIIVRIANFGSECNLDAIEAIDPMKTINPMIKWKIAFIYSNESIIPYYGHGRLKVIGEIMGMANAAKASIADIQRFLISKRDGRDIHEYGAILDRLFKNNTENKSNDSSSVMTKTTESMATTDDHTYKENKHQSYIDILKEAHNLVLTGAPGTGKTFMAQAMANEMGAVSTFVQFHPSYDYTDFVEGLRPIEKSDGQMGFERKDGVFKEFCKEAVINIEDSLKSKEELEDEHSLRDKYNELIDKIENGEVQEIPLKTEGMTMEIVRISDNNNIVLRTSGKTDGREYIVSFDRLAKLAKVYPDEESLNSISNIHKAVTAAIRGCHSSSYWAVLYEVYRQGVTSSAEKPSIIKKKPFVFIIDEINRGEASKIFGELFFAIDPGYRGKTDVLVQTQYQNLVPETDVFAKGFYVPENVYILATMNDIDRSVESMDFAMRRRFTWHEITPDDTESMLDSLPCADEAKERMHRLNNAIAETDGLGAAYMIGPAYFLKLDKNGGDFEKLWKMNIQPLLKEYLRGFRKTEEILEKFSNAYFGKTKETATGSSLLEDEN